VKLYLLSSVVLFAELLFGAPRASADEPSQYQPQFKLVPIPPLVTPSLLAPGEPTGDGGDLSPFFASQPLRLSLTSTIFSVAGESLQYKTREDASGNSIHGFPIQRYQFLRLAPHLVLHGFSSAGCPIDGGLGAGITYTIPVRPSVWLVASAGAYGIPGRPPALPARTAVESRVDLVTETKAGSALRIGIEHKNGTGMQGVPAMVTFGSGF
jgi:hypothetical protein